MLERFTENTTLKDVIRARRADVSEIERLGRTKLDGRIRTSTRAIPSTETDVVEGDAEGDILTEVDGSHEYIYTLLSYEGTLMWDKRQRSF